MLHSSGRGGKDPDFHRILDISSATSGSVMKVIQHLQVLDCKKKKEALWREKLMIKCPLKSPYFLITALYSSCPDTFPTGSVSSLTCLWQAHSEKKNWQVLRWDGVPAPQVQKTVDICYLVCPFSVGEVRWSVILRGQHFQSYSPSSENYSHGLWTNYFFSLAFFSFFSFF